MTFIWELSFEREELGVGMEEFHIIDVDHMEAGCQKMRKQTTILDLHLNGKNIEWRVSVCDSL